MRPAATLLFGLAACFGPTPPTGAPCTAKRDCPDPLVCSPATLTCEREATPVEDAAPDARVDAAIDAPPARTCWPQWRSGTVVLSPPTMIAAASTLDFDHDPSFVPGDLELYFIRGFSSAGDVHRAVRPTRTAPFVSAGVDSALSSSGIDGRAGAAAGHTLIVLSSNRNGGTGVEDLYQATRASAMSPFGTPSLTPLAAVNTTMSELDPDLSPDGLRLYFSRIDGQPQRVWRATRQTPTDPFGAPVVVEISDSPMVHADPTVSPDDLVMVYTTIANNHTDLRLATRTSSTDRFSDDGPLSINTGSNEGDSDLSDDGCELVFASDRGGGNGARDIWLTTVTN